MNVAREEQFTRPVPHTCPACSPEIGDRSNGFDLDEGVRHGTTMSLGTFRCHGVALLVTWVDSGSSMSGRIALWPGRRGHTQCLSDEYLNHMNHL